MNALERLHNLERRETRIAVAWQGVGPLEPRYSAYQKVHQRIIRMIDDIEHAAHLAERDLLWPDGMPAHP